MSPEIAAALVGGIAGLLSGAVASLVAPWVQWAIEKRRKSIEYKELLIKELRALIDRSENIEEIMASSLWGFIESNLTKEERGNFCNARVIHVTDHKITQGKIKMQIIGRMVARLENEWHIKNT